jgi:hypothetical protein
MNMHSKSPRRLIRIIVTGLAVLAAKEGAAALFSDDFNDGNAQGWAQHDPLNVGNFSFPGGNSYRLQAGASPNLNVLGPGRIAAFRNDLNLTDFQISVDAIDWLENNQFFGILARTRQIGLGTLDAYLLSYSPGWFTNAPYARFAIDRLDNEGRTRLIEQRFDPLDTDHQYRFVFSGNGDQLSGALYDLANPNELVLPLLITSDATYTAGVPGIVVVGSLVNNALSDATFDNFVVNVPEASSGTLIMWLALILFRVNRRRCWPTAIANS